MEGSEKNILYEGKREWGERERGKGQKQFL